MMPTSEQFQSMLGIYGYASQAFWRSFEIEALSRVMLERPILEIGCADGEFSREVCGSIEVGVDINPIAVERARRSGIFKSVILQDARKLDGGAGFRTVLANSVLEHIPNLDPVLVSSYNALESGGKLVLTVPLVDINAAMLFGSSGWIRYRHDRLCHVNLWTLECWIESLQLAGFSIAATERFLSARQIRLWDMLDGVAVLGTRRINIGSISTKLTRSLPRAVQRFLFKLYTWLLGSQLSSNAGHDGCCALIVATKA